jgi:hypothetical protein
VTYPRIQNCGLPNEEAVAASAAFEEICRMLQLSPTEDALRDTVADMVIDCVKKGMLDRHEMLTCVERELTRGA